MNKKAKGFALIQALFFMMFIMAVASITMLMSNQRAVGSEGDRVATDAYPALNALLVYGQSLSTTAPYPYTIKGKDYFLNNPLYSNYITTLTKDGFSDPTLNDNLILTLS